MVAVSFGGYATSLFVGEDASAAWNNVFITALLLVMLAVNLVGAQFVAAAQSRSSSSSSPSSPSSSA